MMKADGFDAAMIGIAQRCGSEDVIAYDAERCIEIIVEKREMTHDDAMEYFLFNVSGAYVGEGTPIFVWTEMPVLALKTCPECGGEGECVYEVEVPAPMAWRGGWLEERMMECQLCQGTGEVDDCEGEE